jgi:murein tripeptide amidase MpaA
MKYRPTAIAALSVFIMATASAQVDWTAPLPPLEPWDGKSRELVVGPDDPWITPAEQSGLTESPTYDETVSWLRRLADTAPELTMVTIGRSEQGREIWMVIASAEGVSTPAALRALGKPTVLAQGGIHAGEIDGKDAGMMLLRDMTVRGTRRDLLERANLLFVPIFNVDGHERSSPYNRMNQRGPTTMGWRTNAKNLNLNRDYAKADSAEMRAMITVINEWSPDLYLDLHVTDGEDYQYDITFGFNGSHAHSPAIARWLEESFTPMVNRRLEEMGHTPGPLVFGVDRLDFSAGISGWTASPRFSNGYGDARHLPTVLLENHSLKPFDRRVLGTYVFLESAMRVAGERARELRQAIETDRQRRPEHYTLSWSEGEPLMINFAGIESVPRISPVTGGVYLDWTGRAIDMRIPLKIHDQPGTVARPVAWWIPAEWGDVIERLALHGVEMERIDEPVRMRVEMIRLASPKIEATSFEGRVRVSAEITIEVRDETFPRGSVRVSTDQPLAGLAALLLEPESPDSFFQWGFFHAILSRTEYYESYAMEPLAARMLEQDLELRGAYIEALRTDPVLRGSPRARLDWFYERTPYFDDRWLLYPVARERAAGSRD